MGDYNKYEYIDFEESSKKVEARLDSSPNQNTSSTRPSGLPAGWSMEWEPSTSYGSDE